MKKYASFQIDGTNLDRLDQVAKQSKITRSQLLRELIEKCLKEKPLEESQVKGLIS